MIGYYYCSLETFLNIIKNKEIYLSDPLKMNDKSEIRWYLNRLNDKQNNDGVCFSILESMKIRSGLDFSYDNLLDILNFKGQKSIYISCFSKKPDLLSQWRAYADNGNGVSIGFDLDKLAIADNFLIQEVIYTDNIIEDVVENDVEIVADQIGTVIDKYEITDKATQIEVFLHELIPVLAKYKNPAFKEEKEIRLIYCDDLKFEKILDSYGAFKDKWETKKLTHDFRTINNNDITEFVKLNFEPTSIKEIYIGPKCLLNNNNILNISQTLLGIEPEITPSISSYR